MQTPRTIWLPGLVFALSVLTMPLSGCGGGGGGDGAAADKPAPIYNPDPNNPKMGIPLDKEADFMKKGQLKPTTPKKGPGRPVPSQ